MFLASTCTCAVYGKRRLLQSAHVQVLAKNMAAKKNTLRFCSRSYVSVCKYSVIILLSRFSTWRICSREQAKSECDWLVMSSVLSPSGISLGEFVRANKEKGNLIGWRQTLTTSPANHIHFLFVRANKFAKWKTGFIHPVNE